MLFFLSLTCILCFVYYCFKLVWFHFQRETHSPLNSSYKFQVLTTPIVIPAHNHLLVLTTQAPPAVVTANPIKHRLLPSSQRARSESARPSHRSRQPYLTSEDEESLVQRLGITTRSLDPRTLDLLIGSGNKPSYLALQKWKCGKLIILI